MRIEDPTELASLFEADRETHVYGLADLEEPYWSHSSWFRDGDAAVGLVSVGDDWVTGYAMSQVAPQPALGLLHGLLGEMPPGTWVTGPIGMHASMPRRREVRSIGAHWRMILDDLADVPGWEAAVRLDPDDLAALVDLYGSDPGKAFFLPAMLDHNPFVGVWEEDRLVAAAGTHVASELYGVAAVGAVITRPSHRGRGLGKAVVASLCHRLVPIFETVGLNVEAANTPALNVYDQLGFRRAFQYEEIEVL
jgi:ribosomal protein S18 acetylase RimI-like enzyme